METIKIKLNSTQDMIRFNKRITKYDCDFDLEVGHNYVDAKSLLGLYSLSLHQPMLLHIQADPLMADKIREDLLEFCCEADAVVCGV